MKNVKLILLSTVALLFSMVTGLSVSGQQINAAVKGLVKNQSAEALSNVNVQVRNKKNIFVAAAITDAAGLFTFKTLQDGETYSFALSHVGYTGKLLEGYKYKTGETITLSVQLTLEAESMSQVVVVGYGSVKRSDLTGVVGSVKAKELMERPAISAEQSLAGKIAGVNVSTNSGKPGGRTSVSIRGFSSINASNDPLYIVDGIEWTEGLSNINPNDIESIDVLKDASATAIYGTKGSNGVIMVTTKRGNKNRNVVSYDNFISVNQLPPTRNLEVLNARQWLDLEETVYKNAPKFDAVGYAAGKYVNPVEKRKAYLVGNTLLNRELFKLDETGVPQPLYDNDWSKMVFRNAVSQNHNISITGGSNNSNYGLFMGYANDNGVIQESFQKKYNVRLTVDQHVNDWLKVGATASYSKKMEGGVDDANGSYNVIRNVVEMVPFIPFKYSDGTYGYGGDYAGLEKLDNPLSETRENNILNKTSAFNGNAYATIKLMKGLEFTSTLGSNIINEINPRFNSSKLQGGTRINTSSINSNETSFWVWSNRLNYTRQLNVNNQINVLLGAEQQKQNYLSWTAATTLMPDDYYAYFNLGAGATPLAPTSGSSAYQMQSYFGRVNYNFKDKYLFTATGRFDGSSRFGENNQFAFFPSAAAAWRISKENFLKTSKVITDWKLRLSYGLTGNSAIGSYRSLANLATNAYIFGSRASGISIGSLANPDLKWEKTSQLNLGTDINLLNNRFTISVDAYYKNTLDLLLDAPVPSSSGYTTVTKNIGNMENKGLEISLNIVNLQQHDLKWSTNFNFSWLKNKVTKLGTNNADIIYGFKENQIIRVGESVGSIFGYVRDGIYSIAQTEEAKVFKKLPGDVIIRDLNNDGVINANDRMIIGKGIPDFYGTLSNTVQYKNFYLVLELQYQQGNQIFNNTRNSSEGRFGIANNYATVLNSWTPTNQGAVLEQIRPTGYSYFMDTRKLSDGSFIRGKNLLLSYNLNKSIVDKMKISSLRIFTSIQNFFVVTKYFGYDPEVNNYNTAFSQGITYSNYPKPRTFMFGINLTL